MGVPCLACRLDTSCAHATPSCRQLLYTSYILSLWLHQTMPELCFILLSQLQNAMHGKQTTICCFIGYTKTKTLCLAELSKQGVDHHLVTAHVITAGQTGMVQEPEHRHAVNIPGVQQGGEPGAGRPSADWHDQLQAGPLCSHTESCAMPAHHSDQVRFASSQVTKHARQS